MLNRKALAMVLTATAVIAVYAYTTRDADHAADASGHAQVVSPSVKVAASAHAPLTNKKMASQSPEEQPSLAAAALATVNGDDSPPVPPSVAPARDRPELEPLTSAEVIGKKRHGIELLSQALARVEEQLEQAQGEGDAVQLARLRVRRKRLLARLAERQQEIDAQPE